MNLKDVVKNRILNESCAVKYDKAAPLKVVLAYPNEYSLGMASLGYQCVFNMLNCQGLSICERVFLPDKDEIVEYERSNQVLFSYESQTVISDFHVLAFSIYFELDYINILKMLQLSHIPLLRKDRDEAYPLVIAGGPCATFNPEPLTDFIDAFVIGDAESSLDKLTECINRHYDEPRDVLLDRMSEIEGVYVSGMKNKVKRAVAHNLDDYNAFSCISTKEAEFGDIDLVEVARGCARGCRFCVTGFINRPLRPRNVVKQLNEKLKESARFGLVGAAVFDNENSVDICEKIVEAGCEFSLSSLRLETVTPQIAELLVKGGQKTLTIAPEAGTERLRRIINKNISQDDLYNAINSVYDFGVRTIKLYFMIGLPEETSSDILGIVNLVKDLSERYKKCSFQVSASCFVPKPWTPFQWHSMEREIVLKKRMRMIEDGLKGIKRIKVGGESPRLAIIQGVFARGSVEIGDFIMKAFECSGDYKKAIRNCELDIDGLLHRKYEFEHEFAWDHIDMGLEKAWLWKEYKKSFSYEDKKITNFD